LARRSEVTSRSILYLENGAHQPYADTIHRLASALALSESDRQRLERAGGRPDRLARGTPDNRRSASTADAAPSGAATPSHNLPARLTSFIGREREHVELGALLDSARLVTLTGPGGIGKTRLALEVAASRLGTYPDGIWMVELAGISDDRLVPEAVASVLVKQEQGRRAALTWLTDALRSRRLLLVLDNCEHLIEACAELAEHLLQACPGVQILATSREGLGIAGDQVWQVPPLRVPEGQPSLARLRDEPAVQLFVERARAASARFQLSDETAGSVVEICRRLDGLPLAIELAASRTGLLMAREIAARLDDRFRLLAAGSRTAPARHQTLRAVVDWSYELASAPARLIFERLSVFAGGFTLEAAEAVAGIRSWVLGDGERVHESSPPDSQHPTPMTPVETLDLLGQLVSQSLVHAEDGSDGTRYRLLETLRAYAGERLAARGETAAVQRRHAEYYLSLARAADLGLRGPEQARWAARLAREYDNLQAALRWSTTRGESVLAHRLVAALGPYWYSRPRGVEGAHWSEQVLALGSESVPPAARAKVLMSASGQAVLEGNIVLARQRCQESLALYETLGDSLDHAQALLRAGLLAAIGRELETARTQFQESLAMFRRLGARRGGGWTLGFLGQGALFAGNYERAATLLGDSAQILREIGDYFGLAVSLFKAGDVACCQGNLGEARAHYEESLVQSRAAGMPLATPTLLHNLACVLRKQQERGRAAALFHAGLEVYRDRGDEAGVACCLLGLADVALDVDEPRLTALLLGAAERLPRGRPLGMLGGWLWAGQGRPPEAQVAAAQDALGAAAFEAAFAEGQALAPELAAEEALQALGLREEQDSPSSTPEACASGGLAGTVLDLRTRRARRSTEHPSPSAATHV
jgi:non-specific serine/threonine protein kinase